MKNRELQNYEMQLIEELTDAKLSWKTVLKVIQLYAIQAN